MNPLANRDVQDTLTGLGQITLLARDAFASLLRLRMKWHDVLFQIYFIGVKSQTVVLITGAFTGMVLARRRISSFTRSRWTRRRWRLWVFPCAANWGRC